jgi:hypothetical protein
MVITGTPVTVLDFHNDDADLTRRVFDASGGGAVYQAPPANIGSVQGEGGPGTTVGTLASNVWGFKDALHATRGYYIKGVGLDTDTNGREILAYLKGMAQAVCEQVNRGLGLAPTPAVQTTAVDYTLNTGKGDVTAAAVQGTGTANVFAPAALGGQAFACARQGAAGTFDYYHALVEQ